MDYKYIKQLLERYWNCETSLEEEDILRTFFSQEDIPSELESYKALFTYELGESKNEALGDDFDQKMMDIIEGEESQKPEKAKVISLTERLKPLFKAAAMVGIFLTLGNAAQVPFQKDAEYVGNTGNGQSVHGVSVAAIADSVSVDSMQQSNINQVAADPASNILK